jgi:hypothetical protein
VAVVMVPVMSEPVLQYRWPGTDGSKWSESCTYKSFDGMLADKQCANRQSEYREVLDGKVLRHATSASSHGERVISDFRVGAAVESADTAAVPALDDIARMWLLLGAREKQLLHLVTTRLLSGQQQYGKLTPRKKNAAKETLEEACDASIYTAMGMLDLMDEGK